MEGEGPGPDARARFRVARFIMEAGVKLGLGSVAVATACGAFHRCCRALGARPPHDPHLVAAAAIALAAKAEGTPLRTRDLLNVTHRCLHPGVPPLALDAEFWALRDSLMQCELWVLRVLQFRLPLAQAHKYLAQFALALGQWARGGRGGAAGVAWALLRDGAAGGLGLGSPPQHVAAAALHLAMELCGCGAPPGAPPHWWQVLSPGLGQAELEELERELLGLYGLDTEVGGDDPPCAPQVTPGPPPSSPAPRPGPSRPPQYRHRPFRAPPD